MVGTVSLIPRKRLAQIRVFHGRNSGSADRCTPLRDAPSDRPCGAQPHEPPRGSGSCFHDQICARGLPRSRRRRAASKPVRSPSRSDRRSFAGLITRDWYRMAARKQKMVHGARDLFRRRVTTHCDKIAACFGPTKRCGEPVSRGRWIASRGIWVSHRDSCRVGVSRYRATAFEARPRIRKFKFPALTISLKRKFLTFGC